LDETIILEIVLNLTIVFSLILLHGVFVAFENSLSKLRITRLTQLVEEGNSKAVIASRIKKSDGYFIVAQMGIILTALSLGWLVGPALGHSLIQPLLGILPLSESAIYSMANTISFVTIALLLILLGKIIPSTVATQKLESTALRLSNVMLALYLVFYPIIWIISRVSNRFVRLLGLQPAEQYETTITEEEIRSLVDESHKSGHIDLTEMKLMDNVFTFTDRLAREIMVPRRNMECLFENYSFLENMQIIRDTRHTRYLVALEDKDQIIGFIHVMDILSNQLEAQQNFDLTKLVRPTLTVPESIPLSHVLVEMQKRRTQIAVLIDEYGGTAGMVTLEDIIEELVGDIQDEFDNERPEIEAKTDHISVDGRALIGDIKDQLQIDINDSSMDTIGGWIYSQLEDAPEVGTIVRHEHLVFEVTEIDHLRISRIKIYEDPNKEQKPFDMGQRELSEGA
jgi:CBS domain containing-hemolysin-like protein